MAENITIELMQTEATIELRNHDVVCELPKLEVSVKVEE